MLDYHFVKSALIRHNYFPYQRKNAEELPPVFSSEELTDDLIEKILDLSYKRKSRGYDSICYRATRFNNISRPITIPHPKPYFDLVDALARNWKKFHSIEKNLKSIIRPRKHDDGRVIVMDYETTSEKIETRLHNSFGTKYVVHSDVKNFYPSIYSHSIPWALIGIEEAKEKRNPNFWFNQIDQKVRRTNRCETNGIPIGPATSNIIAEIILSKIDEKLQSKYERHIRYVDDYTSFHETKESAENFIIDLENYLAEYKLIISINKTEIVEQPTSLSPNWLSDLSLRMPKGKDINQSDALRFLDYANEIRNEYPDGSVIKYAVKSIASRLDANAEATFIDYVLNISVKYPIVLPFIETILNQRPIWMNQERKNKIKVLLHEHIKYNRHDIVCWLLFYVIKYKIRLNEALKRAVVDMNDCLSSYMLFLKYPDFEYLTERINQIVESGDEYKWDNNWLLIYEVFRNDLIENPYKDGVFEIMKEADFKFHSEEKLIVGVIKLG